MIVSIPDLSTLTYFSDRIPCTFTKIIWFIFRKRQDIILAGNSAMLETLSKKHSVTSVSLKNSLTDALEEYVCKLYQPEADIV